MKKFFKGLAKYFGVILGVIVCVAGVKVANFFMTRQPEVEEEQSEFYGQEEENALTKMVNKIMETENGNVDASFVIETSSNQQVQINSNISFKMANSNPDDVVEAGEFALDGLVLSAQGGVLYDGSLINFEVVYVDGYVYANVADIELKLSTSNIMEDVSSLLSLGMFEKLGINISLPEISLDSFDTSLLMELSQSIQEEEIEEGKKITLDLFGMGEVAILTDAEYAIKSIAIEELNINGVKVKADVATELNTVIPEIKKPENSEKIVDVSKFNSLMVAFDKLLEKGYVAGTVNINVFDEEVVADYAVDFREANDIKAYLSTSIFSKELVATYKSNKLWISYDECKYYFDVREIDFNTLNFDAIIEKIEYIAEKFSFEIPTIQMPDVNSVEMTSLFGLSNLINNFTIDENGILVEIDGFEGKATIKNQEFEMIEILYDDFDIQISLNETLEIPAIDEDEYLNIEKLEELFNGLIEQISEKKIATLLKVKYEDLEVEAKIYVDFTSGFKAKVVTKIENYDFELLIIDRVAFVEVNGLKVKYDLAEKFDIDELIGLGLEMIQEKVANIDVNVEQISEIKNAVDFKLIKVSQNKLVISVNDALVEINLTENSLKDLAFVYGETSLIAEILSNDFEIETNGEYFKLNGIEDFVPAILKLVEEKRFAFSTMISVQGVDVEVVGKVDLRQYLRAELLISTFEQTLKVNIIKDNIYIEFNNLKIKGTISELFELTKAFVANVEISSFDMTNFDLFNDLQVSSNELSVVLKMGLSLILTKDNDRLTNISLGYADFDVDLNISLLEEEVEYVEFGEYQKLSDFIKLGKLAYDYISNTTQLSEKKFASEITLNVADFEVKAKLFVDLTDELKAEIVMNLNDIDLDLIYKDETIYATVNGLKLKYEIGEVDLSDFVVLIKNYISQFVAIPEVSIKEEQIVDLIKNLNFKLEEIDDEFVKIRVEDFVLSVNVKDFSINNISVIYDCYMASISVLSNDFEIETNGEYFKLNGVEDFVPAILKLVEEKRFAFSTMISVQGVDVEIIGKVDLREDILAELLISTFDQTIKINVVNDDIYVEFNNLKIKGTISELVELATVFASNVEIPTFDLTNFDLFDNFEVSANQLNIALKIGLSLILKKDNGSITNIAIGYEDYDLELNISSLEEDIRYVEEGDFQRLSDFIKLGKLAYDYVSNTTQLSEKKFASEITLNVADLEVKANIYVDFADELKAKITTSFDGYDIEAIYKDDTIFVQVNELKIKYEIETTDIDSIIGAIKEFLGQFVEIPEISISENDIRGLIENFEFEILQIEEDYAILKFNDLVLDFTLKANNIENISVAYADYSVSAKILSNNFEIETKGEYFKLNGVEDFVPEIVDLVQYGKVELSTSLNIADINIKINAKVDFRNGIKAKAQIKALDKIIEIDVLDGTVYVQFANFKAKASFEELLDIINSYNLKINEFDTSLDLFDNIEVQKDLLAVALKAGVSISLISENNKLSKVNVILDEFDINIDVKQFEEELKFNLDEEFENLVDYYNFAINILKFIENEDLAFEIDAIYDGYHLTGKVQYINGEVSFEAETEIIGRKLKLNVIENTIYVDFDGLKLKCDIDNIQELVEYVEDYLGLDLSESLDSISNISVDDIIDKIFFSITDGKLTINYESANIVVDSDEMIVSVNYDDVCVMLSHCSVFEASVSGNYIDLFEIKELSKAVYNTVKNMSISGEIDVTIELFGEKNPISIDYAIGYIDGKVIGYVETEFKGININAYIDGKDIYLYVVGLQIHFNLDDKDELIDWINETFDLDLSIDFMDEFKLEDYHLDFIDRVETDENAITAYLTNGIKIEVEYDEYISKVIFTQDNREATLVCTDFNLVSIENLEREAYRDYSEFTDLISNVYNLIISKQYKFTANVKRYNDTALTDNITANVALDVTGALNAYANLTGVAEEMTAIYEDKVLYFCYGGANGLKVAINEGAVQEILSIALSALNVDTSSIPYLDEFLSKEDIDTTKLSSILPKVEFGNPLSYLEYIDGFELADNIFTINLKAEKLGIETLDDKVAVKMYYADEKITKVELRNLYINPENREYINVTINIKDFDKVPKATNKEKYIDLSSSSDLIKSFVNTSQLNDYHINGKIKLNVSIGVDFSAATVGVDALIKREVTKELVYDEELGEYVEIEKSEIVGQVVLSNYPIIALVNNENTNGGLKRVRTISMYFKGGFVYLYTDDAEKSLYKEYQRATKVTTEYLLNNLEYYMQYLLGFTDTIQNEINKSIKSSREYSGVVHYDDMIKSYSHTGKKHTIVLNLAEIAHNDDIGNLTIILTTKNDASTQNKDYLYRLDVNMEVFNGMLSLKTTESSSTDAIFLKDIGTPVSMAGLESFISSYDVTNNLGTDGEYYKEGTSAWKQENKGNVTLKFYDRGTLISTLTGAIASSLKTPSVARDADDDGNTRQEYEFGGWYYDEELTMPFTSDTFPRISNSLFAKWNKKDLKYYSTLHFETNETSAVVADMTSFAGSSLTLPVCSNIAEENGDISILKEFKGWALADGTPYTANVYPSERNTTVYAVWEIKQTVIYNVTVHYNTPNGAQTFVDKASAGSTYSFPTTDYIKATTKFYTSSAYTTQVTDFTVNANVVWYARNEYSVIVRSDYTTNGGSAYSSKTTMYEGETITLTKYADYQVNMGSYHIKYSFLGYKVNGGSTISGGNVSMPSANMQYVAEWSVKEYCTVTFNNTWVQPSGWKTSWGCKITRPSSVPSLGSIEVERNTAINPTDYNIKCTAKYKAVGIERSYYFFVLTWNTNSAQTIFSVTPVDGNPDKYDKSPITITQNITLYPTWNATM